SSADANQEATKRVIEAVVADHSGSNRSLWSAAKMKGAAATYLKSLCDASTRAKKGKQEAHRNLCRKQGRTREVGSKDRSKLAAERTAAYKEYLTNQGYSSKLVSDQFSKASAIPRKDLLRTRGKETKKLFPFVIT
ncbi:hypothetical protein pdam_00024189, partial [Pocillopora damicornis]